MKNKRSEICEYLLQDPDAIYPPICHSSIVLEKKQLIELDKIRQDVRKLCEEGKDEEAERGAELAARIVSEGPPIREG